MAQNNVENRYWHGRFLRLQGNNVRIVAGRVAPPQQQQEELLPVQVAIVTSNSHPEENNLVSSAAPPRSGPQQVADVSSSDPNMIINISKQSDHSFRKLKSVGLITRIIEELGNNDVLLKMNIIEILSQLAQSEHGYVFLDKSGILQKIFFLIDEDELTTQLCQPGILKFFGHIGYRKPREMLIKYPRLFDILFSNIESADLIIVGISLDTIGYIGLTSQGKLALESTGNQIETVIKTISRLLGSLPTEIRVRALNCIENLLRVTDGRNDIMAITQSWYGLLGADPMDVILKYAKNPFSELRLAGLGILNAISGQHWGQEAIRNTPGLVEFLLDRSVETIKECKEAKYEIVKLLSYSTVFEHSALERLLTFVKEGPFYVHAVTEVAIEGN